MSKTFHEDHCCKNHCFCCKPSASQSMIDHSGSDSGSPSASQGDRARRAGIRIGSILGVLVRGILGTRLLAKKQVVEGEIEIDPWNWEDDE